MTDSEKKKYFHCEITIRGVAGETIYEARTSAPAGAVLQSLNIAKQRFVEWLDGKDREGISNVSQ